MTAGPLFPHLGDLSQLEQALWRELEAAPRDRSHGWRVASLATLGEDGEAQVRSVVLRDVDTAERSLVIYTDARSPKAAQLARHPRGQLLCWCPRRSWQLRMDVSAEVQTSGLDVSSRWARLKLSPGAQDYLSPVPPGTPLADVRPVVERASRNHFALIVARVHDIDWLELSEDGHRRALFAADGRRTWLQP